MATQALPHGLSRLRPWIRCPHCWHRFRTEDIAWVARHEELRGDPVLGPEHYVRFSPTRFNVQCEALDSHGMPCQELACPRCHLVIPRVFLNYPGVIFSLIGAPFSGKSYLLTSMTWELGRILPTRFFMVFGNVDASTNSTLIGYQTSLFLNDNPDQEVGIIKTQIDNVSHYDSVNLSGQPVLLPRPFLYGMRPLNEHPCGAEAEQLARVICLYDNAGEHYLPGEDRTLAPGTQHMARSKVLMFLYDPTQDTRFRQQCSVLSEDPQLGSHAQTQLQGPILTEAVNRVRQHAGIVAHKRLEQPLIVLVSKSDIWAKLIDEDLDSEPYIDPSPPDRKYASVDVTRIDRTSAKIRNLLHELTPEFVATAEDCCDKVVYIPVSALGCSPRPQARQSGSGKSMLVVRAQDIKPRWVTVPMVYAFAVWSRGLFAVR